MRNLYLFFLPIFILSCNQNQSSKFENEYSGGIIKKNIDDEIYSLNYSHFSLDLFPEVENMDLSAPSLYELIEKELNFEIVRAIQTLEATPTTPEISKIIHRQIGSPLLLMSRVTFIIKNSKEMPFEFVKVYFMPDKYKCEVQLSK